MRIAVTGASGFVGGRAARRLAAAGHEVWAFGRRTPSALAVPLARYASWDLARAPTDLSAVDAVVHCAAHVAQWGPAEVFDAVNVRGTAHLLASLQPGTPVVLVSTASVYDGRRLPPYATSKLRSEALVQRSGHPHVILRPHVVYGPGDTTLWPRVRAAVRRGRLLVPGDGRGRISVTHVDNLADAIVDALHTLECGRAVRGRAVERGAEQTHAGAVLDIADAHVPTVEELLRIIFHRQGIGVRLQFVPAAVAYAAACASELAWWLRRRTDDPPLTRYVVRQLARPDVLDIAPARAAIGYVPRWSVLDGPL